MSVLAGSTVLDQLFDEIDLEKEFLDFFREHHQHFAEGHAATGGELSDDDQIGGGAADTDEHPHIWKTLHGEYCARFEQVIEGWVTTHTDLTLQQFFEKVNEADDREDDDGAVAVLISITEYARFVAKMKAEAKKFVEAQREAKDMGLF